MENWTTTELLHAATAGNSDAWAAIVDRYERLVWSVARGFRYDDATTADIVQTVWLRLAEHCARIRDPEQLASWLARTCRNECIGTGRRNQHEVLDDVIELRADPNLGRASTLTDVDHGLIEHETRTEMLLAFDQLGDACRELLQLVCADPPVDYATISERTGRPVGSIGPTRSRCLDKLRTILASASHEPVPAQDGPTRRTTT